MPSNEEIGPVCAHDLMCEICQKDISNKLKEARQDATAKICRQWMLHVEEYHRHGKTNEDCLQFCMRIIKESGHTWERLDESAEKGKSELVKPHSDNCSCLWCVEKPAPSHNLKDFLEDEKYRLESLFNAEKLMQGEDKDYWFNQGRRDYAEGQLDLVKELLGKCH